MDIVLEICDYYIFDQLYATLLPTSTPLPEVFASTLQTGLFRKSDSHNSTAPGVAAKAFDFVMSFQNPNEVYGAPRYLPASDYTFGSALARSNFVREAVSLFAITAVFGFLLYFITAYCAYLFVFDKKIFNHPRYLKNQIGLEIWVAATSIPLMVLLTLPFFMLEVNGFSKLYFDVNESTGGWNFIFLTAFTFIMFTDCFIYLIHRVLHWPTVYKHIHKPHHKWIVCTPFASHAFHPVDGYFQSLPYHWYPFLFPIHKVLFLGLFTFVNFWTVMIHDGYYFSNDPVVNGTACHTVHHLYFNYNYGQFTTLWDRIGGSYRRPDDSLFVREPVNEDKIWQEQVVQMENIRGELEGKDDDRVYN